MVSEGNNQASLALGEIFYMGCHNKNNQPDYSKAYEVLMAPASAGIPEAQNFIGIILKDGRLGFKDDDSARLWFEKAAWQGNSKACANLAEFWDYQSENRKCRIEALRWMIVADSLGEIVSRYHLLDITPLLAKDEESAARKLAELTISLIKSKPKKPN
jgi:TPR repeat protein